MQGVLGVVVEDGDGFLGEDRPGVDVLGDEVDSRARHLHPELERVAHRVPSLERGKQRGVRVDGPAAVRVDERLREDGAEAGDGDEVDVVALEDVDDVVRVGDPVETGAEVGALDELGRDAVLAGDVERAARPIGDDQRRSGGCGPSRARRMVPLPDARTPTRMIGTLSRAIRHARLSGGNPQVAPRKVFHFPLHEGESIHG